MKNIFIICSSLILLGGLGFNQYNAGLKNLSQGDTRVEASAGLQTYWFKKSRKELLRDTH